MDEQTTNTCHCGKATNGFKCTNNDCGAKSETRDPEHKHEGVSTCEPCCTGCDEAKSNCGCEEMMKSM